jgi:hypothetical protein
MPDPLTTPGRPSTARPPLPPAPDTRTPVLVGLAGRGGLWPLLPWNPCALCALTRRTPDPAPLCDGCRRLRRIYGTVLADLEPAALTARDWSLGAAVRTFKDAGARIHGPHARALAAILSAFLEARLGPAALAPSDHAQRVIAPVPSAHPAIPAALARARHEDWWAPELRPVARVRDGVPGQRRRPRAERLRIDGKWLVDAAAVASRDVLVLDDVCSTGATVHSFARALRDAGAREVRAIVLARNAGPDGHWILPLLQARHAVGVRWRAATPKPRPLA